jgi:arabinan endo-1,5-alpha-L-arabinosidase
MKPIKHAHPSLHVRPVMLLLGAIAIGASSAFALNGQVGIHDPSTVIQCNGKWYTWGTGGSALISDDGWTWRGGTRASRGGMAPDVIHVGDRYFQYMGSNPGGQPHGAINMIWSKSLDPNSPDYKWVDGGVVAGSDGVEFCNAIDPGALLDPTDGKLWLTYGSYFGYIRMVQLDPKTGKRIDPTDKPYDLAINCEASVPIYHEGYYYLLATHGSCCRGTDSGYNIRVGRSKKVTGPYVDQTGLDMIEGGGKLVCGSGGRYVGAGHFGLIDLGDGVQKFSLHWEADMDRGGASVVDVLPLLWKDGWPVAGEKFKDGTYEIESARTGTALEIAVEGVAVGGGRRGGGGGAGGRGGPGAAIGGRGGDANAPAGLGGRMGGMARGGQMGGRGADANAAGAFGRGMGGMARGGAPADANGAAMARGGAGARRGGGMGMGGGGGMFGGSGGGPVAAQDVNQVSANWPTGNVDIRMSNYMCQAQQKWTVTAVPDAGGYLGGPYYKITIAGTNRALAVGEDGELVVVSSFTGGPQQLWRIDQLTDGTWRVMPKFASVANESLYLSAVGGSFATLAKFDSSSDKQHWLFKTP